MGVLLSLCVVIVLLLTVDLFVQLSRCMSGLERLSCLLAAVCHDVDHPGLNQSFLVATDNPLAVLYEVIVR